jgi:hypothetical protein
LEVTVSAKPLFLRDIFGWSSWVIAKAIADEEALRAGAPPTSIWVEEKQLFLEHVNRKLRSELGKKAAFMGVYVDGFNFRILIHKEDFKEDKYIEGLVKIKISSYTLWSVTFIPETSPFKKKSTFVSEHTDLMEAYKGAVLQALIADEICVYGAHLLLERWGLSYPQG